jgi:DNA-binding MarR family transcriptional regulator
MDNVVYDNRSKPTVGGETETLLRGLVRAYARLQQEVAGRCGVTGAQCQVLTEIARSEATSVAVLARRLRVDKGWVSRTLAVLEGKGFVVKRPAGDDGRTVSVSLTGAGRERAAEVDRALDEQARRVLGRVVEDRQQATLEALRLLADAVREEAGMERGLRPRRNTERRGDGEGREWRG